MPDSASNKQPLRHPARRPGRLPWIAMPSNPRASARSATPSFEEHPMDRSAVETKLTSIFRDFFGEPALAISAATTAHDIKGWDSIAHVDLLLAVEQGFGIN